LTDATDRYVAVAGVEKQISAALDDESALGIWKKDALRSLLWIAPSPAKKSPSTVVGPSWSWLSANTPIQYRLFGTSDAAQEARHEAKLVPKATVVDVQARSEDPGTFSRYSGELRLRGPLAKIVIQDGYGVVFGLRKDAISAEKLAEMGRGEESDQWLTDYNSDWVLARQHCRDTEWEEPPSPSDDDEIRDGVFTDAYCMLIFQTQWELGSQYAITLEKIGTGSKARYRRLGICVFDSDVSLDSKERCPVETICIV